MLLLLIIVALLAFSGALALPGVMDAAPVAYTHLTLAVGGMPLVMGAMTHFVPVLTRSGAPERWVRAIPVLILAAGFMAFFSFVAPLLAANGHYFAALAGCASAGAMAWWIYRRGAASLGKPHPCLYWYLAAVGCLVLALGAIVAMHFWPEQRLPLRRFHLHLNTLGFIGLTAVGTLQVLLPTAAGRPDGKAAQRLQKDLKWMLAGILLIASGAAWLKPLTWLGVLLLAYPIIRLALAWRALYIREIFRWNGAAPSLGAALAGFAVMLLLGVAHGIGATNGADAVTAYILGFMFPLVTGASSQLLPVWVRPGPQGDWHGQARQRLTNMGGLRAMLFLAAGIASGLGGRWGTLLAAAGLGLFALQLVKSYLVARA